MTGRSRVAVIGLDCGTPGLLFDRFADDMPTLTKLRERSLWGPLRSIVPPITVPFRHVLVTDDFRQRLSAERFSGLSFKPVAYKKVVHIAWEQWDSNAQEPAFHPETGEPEDYLLEGTHDEQLAATMPRLWAWQIPKTIGLQVQGSNTFRRGLHPGTDVAREYFIVWISERLKVWLAENAGKWLSFVCRSPTMRQKF